VILPYMQLFVQKSYTARNTTFQLILKFDQVELFTDNCSLILDDQVFDG